MPRPDVPVVVDSRSDLWAAVAEGVVCSSDLSPSMRLRASVVCRGLYLGTTLSYRSKTSQFEIPNPFLDQDGFAIRAGHHCTQPLHDVLGAAGSARASLYIYNTHEEVDAFVDALGSTLLLLS